MPRTKITKSKRNRDAAKEEREEIKMERLREFDSMSEQMNQNMLSLFNELIEENIQKTKSLKLKGTHKIRSMLFADFINLDKNAIIEMNKTDSVNSSKLINASGLMPKLPTISVSSNYSERSKGDEGYITEDSGKALQQPAFPTGRTPGPLSSAKGRIRRSRSASGLCNSVQKHKPMSVKNEHSSRSRLRTPLLQQKSSARPKAMSADRSSSVIPKFSSNHSPVLRRWAKPGETIISLTGSPIVTAIASDSVANINIPTRNGMLSLKPKRANSSELGRQIADLICPETLIQMEQLREHINMILSLSDKN